MIKPCLISRGPSTRPPCRICNFLPCLCFRNTQSHQYHLFVYRCCGVIMWEHVDAQAEVCNSGVSGDVQPAFVLENCFLFTRCKYSLTALQKSLHLPLHFLSRCVLVLYGGAHKGKGEACECNRLSQITQQLPKRCGRSHRARALNHSVSDKDQHCMLWAHFLTYSDFHCAISSLG